MDNLKEINNFKPGEVVILKVLRTNELGAFLELGETSILLHKAQQTKEIAIGDMVQVYLFKDPKGRLAASMKLPKMREGQIARVKVINTSRDGAFLDIGAERGIFMPFAEMRGQLRIGEVVWAKLYRDKSDRLAMTMDVDKEINLVIKPAENIKVGDIVKASSYRASDEGTYLITTDRNMAFLHNTEKTRTVKIGEELELRVIFVRDDGRINVSMRRVKHEALDVDAEIILQHLRDRDGKMPYDDNASPEIIKAKFNISKGAFKRALGRLMKNNLIEQSDGWTILKEDDKL